MYDVSISLLAPCSHTPILMQVLIASHPLLFTLPDVTGSTPLHHASAHPSPHPLLYLLSHKTSEPLAINVTNSYQRTPLHCAVAYNNVYNADLLLKRQADTQLCDSEGKTPIDYARELETGEDILAILEGTLHMVNNAYNDYNVQRANYFVIATDI